MNKLIKFLNTAQNVREVDEELLPYWHALNPTFNEFTVCGHAVAEYDTIEKKTKRGGINCKACLYALRGYKSIKL